MVSYPAVKKTPAPSNEEILTKKIEDIIPKQYLDTLKLLGLEVYQGTTPPQVTGSYAIKPHVLDTSNVPTDRKGDRFTDAIIRLSDQSTTDYSIKLLAEHYLKDRDTSIATAISGHGNYFTVYGKVKATNAIGKYAIAALVFSGEMDGNGNIRNLRSGMINIDGTHASADFIKEGQGRVAHDSDLISERIAGDERIEGRLSPRGRHEAPGKTLITK